MTHGVAVHEDRASVDDEIARVLGDQITTFPAAVHKLSCSSDKLGFEL